MSKIDDGGTAFPTEYDDRGLSMRDYFAAAAMQSLAPNVFGDALKYRQDPNKALMQLVDGSYGIADAMLAARKEGA
jgi:hypothetical protein